LKRLISIAAKNGWKFTAHVTGGGAVDTLLAAYEEVSKSFNISDGVFPSYTEIFIPLKRFRKW
jgi:predicted amidohydrolase YtcJ